MLADRSVSSTVASLAFAGRDPVALPARPVGQPILGATDGVAVLALGHGGDLRSLPALAAEPLRLAQTASLSSGWQPLTAGVDKRQRHRRCRFFIAKSEKGGAPRLLGTAATGGRESLQLCDVSTSLPIHAGGVKPSGKLALASEMLRLGLGGHRGYSESCAR